MATISEYMTSEQLLAMPEDGVDRELVLGQLRERGMTRRNRKHTYTLTKLARYLDCWLDTQSEPRGVVLSGDAAFRLTRNPDTTVGIDVAYISAETAQMFSADVFLIDAAPILAAEILSPSDKHEDVVEKIGIYLSAGVPVVWILDPDLKTIQVHRPGQLPQMVNLSQELSAEPELPGFRVPVAHLFEA